LSPATRRIDPWIGVPLAALAIVTGADVLLGPDVVLISALIVGPLFASLRLDPRHTAVVAGFAMLIAGALGVENDVFAETTHFTRILPVLLAGAIGVWLARLRVDRERGVALLAIQGSVSRILSESPTLADAAPRLLRVIGEALGWHLGAVWEVDRQEHRIRRVDRWSAADFDAPGFESLSDEAAYAPGEGLPGRVWESGAPASIPDYAVDPSFPRAGAAAEGGIAAAFAFPVRSGDEVVGVTEFFSTRPRKVDQAHLEMFSGIGRQIGQFIERQRGEEQRAELLRREQDARVVAERAERRAGETVALLDTLLARAPAGFAFIDRDLRYVRVNDALAEVYGRPANQVVGRRVDEVIPGLPEISQTLRRVVSTGQATRDVEVSGEAPGAPGIERHWLASYYPVRDSRGEVTGVGAVVVEITDRKRAERRANFLSEATSALNASLDHEITLANIARLTVPDVADWCVVDVFNSDTRTLSRLAIAHSDPSKERLLWELDRRYPTDVEHDAGAAAAVRTREPQLYERVDESLLRSTAHDEEHLRILLELGLASVMAVPLVARGEPVGVVTFATAESGRVFGEDDVELVMELAARAGRAVENARLYRERSHIARTLQASLLPPRLPNMPGIELAARYRAAGEANDVGGDFYDVFPTGEHTWGVVVGDVLGKGAGAAAMIGLARHTLRAVAIREPDPVNILSTLNEALYRESAQESFCTAAYLAFDVTDDRVEVEVTCAGHPLPLVLRADGELESVGRAGTLLGAVPRLSLAPRRITLAAGDALVVFTDGIVEAKSHEGVLGEDGLRRLLATLLRVDAREMADRVARHAIEFQAGAPRDDLAVLVARRQADEASPSVPTEPDALGAIESDA
jgi:PAS domain S-box-containing protein